MKNTQNIRPNVANLYLLEDATTNTIVKMTTSIESLVEAYYSHASEHLGTGCRFYKLINGNLLELEDNELPEEFLYGYDEYEEYDDCAYCPVCKSWY